MTDYLLILLSHFFYGSIVLKRSGNVTKKIRVKNTTKQTNKQTKNKKTKQQQKNKNKKRDGN